MSTRQRFIVIVRGRSRFNLALLASGLLLAAAGMAPAVMGAEEKTSANDRGGAGVGRSLSAKATIFQRGKLGDEWKIVDEKEGLKGEEMLLGLPGAKLESKNGAVRVTLMANLDRLSPYPIKEAAVVLHDNASVDLDLTLDRGRVDIVNAKKKGAAHVRLRAEKEVWDLTLAKPDSRIALLLYGRWPAGSTFTPKPGPKDVPHTSLLFLVLNGEVVLKHDVQEHLMTAPPGPSLIEWDSSAGLDDTPQRVDKLPRWAVSRGEDTPEGKARKAVLGRFRHLLLEHGLASTLEKLIDSDEVDDRVMAVVAMGAFDQLGMLGKAMSDSRHPDVWEQGVLALRRWIGRGPGQEQILYRKLLQTGRFTEVDAETTCQLLHSFGEGDLAQPATYQTLIDFLEHDKLAVRELAYWHLVRLAPDGKHLGYSPLDPPEKRETAAKKWRQLIPKGKLPPKPKASAKAEN